MRISEESEQLRNRPSTVYPGGWPAQPGFLSKEEKDAEIHNPPAESLRHCWVTALNDVDARYRSRHKLRYQHQIRHFPTSWTNSSTGELNQARYHRQMTVLIDGMGNMDVFNNRHHHRCL